MTVKTGGDKRGWIARWLYRFEVSSQIFRIAFLGITAASTLTSALIAAGFGQVAPWVLGIGSLGSPAFAYIYEKHLVTRKNRERNDRADNFSSAGLFMNSFIRSQAEAAAIEAAVNGGDPEKAAEQRVIELWNQFRDGVDIEELEQGRFAYHDD